MGPLAASIMRVMWSRGEGSVQVVRERLADESGRSHAYTTVMTILTRLYERGLLDREKVGRAFVYRPHGDESMVLTALSDRAVDRLIEQYGTTAMRRFAHHLAELDPELRARLIALAEGESK